VAGAARARGDGLAAVRAYVTAAACDPTDRGSRHALDDSIYAEREYQAVEALVAEAEASFEGGDVAAALESLTGLAGAEGATGVLAARIHNDLGVIAAGLGHMQDAEAAVRRALELAPDYAPAKETLAWLREGVAA
jgi:Flp pilus assembly protein TadD